MSRLSAVGLAVAVGLGLLGAAACTDASGVEGQAPPGHAELEAALLTDEALDASWVGMGVTPGATADGAGDTVILCLEGETVDLLDATAAVSASFVWQPPEGASADPPFLTQELVSAPSDALTAFLERLQAGLDSCMGSGQAPTGGAEQILEPLEVGGVGDETLAYRLTVEQPPEIGDSVVDVVWVRKGPVATRLLLAGGTGDDVDEEERDRVVRLAAEQLP